MAARTLQPEDQIAHYRIVAPLGAGGMGEVYLAQDGTLGRQVALKILPPELVRSQERVRRFVQEAKSASSLNHPNIVTIYEIGEAEVRSSAGGAGISSGPLQYISMEVVAGKTLAAKIYDERTDLRTLLGYLAQAAEGIAKAHAVGIVHRDLKPGNIMVSDDGFAKVLDFGLAKLTETQAADPALSTAPTHDGDHTQGGVAIGTAGYMSPEQTLGKIVDPRSDVFSFGCIVYEATTRSRAFNADSVVETMHKILHDKPKPVEELNPAAPAELRRLIRKCLAKSPDQRMQSMKDVALDLREIADEFETLSASGSSGSSQSTGVVAALPSPPRGTSRAWIAGVAAVALIGVLGIAGVLYGMRARHGVATGAAAAPPALAVTSVPSRGGVSSVALSPDGRYLAYVSGAGGGSALIVRQVSTGSEIKILTSERPTVFVAAFSPSGEHVWYVDVTSQAEGATLYQVPALGGAPKKITTQIFSGIGFSPDAKRICFVRGNPSTGEQSLVLHDLAGGDEKTLQNVKLPFSFEGDPAWSPDGKSIATAVHTPANGIHAQLVVVGVDDGKEERLGTTGWEVNSLVWRPDGSGLILGALKYGASEYGLIWDVAYPGGESRRITNDTSSYYGVSTSRDGVVLACVRQSRVANLWTLPLAGKVRPRQITFNTSSDSSVSRFSPAGNETILFSATAEHQSHVYSIGSDGERLRQLTSGTDDPEVRSLPDGGFVAATYGDDHVAHMARADADGGNLRRIASGAGEWIQDISGDGSTILFIKVDSLRDIWSVPTQGGEARKLAGDSDQVVGFSPDHTRIAYLRPPEIEGRSDRTLLVIPAGGGEPSAKITLPPNSSNFKWTPDGKAISFLADAGAPNLSLKPLSGGAAQPITKLTDGQIQDYAWAPDGKTILLVRRMGDVANLWSVGSDGRDPAALTDFLTGSVFDLRITRDGKTVIFTYGNETQDAVLMKGFR
ncbi:MAG TPA: protein kinase [Candidatus Polarisedimenticolaceae bacterium]|nr:protein kinase [Candidatus Polarisedimenticolaceae bacterium]